METSVFILLFITLLIRLLIGIRLFANSKQNNLPNLQWLAWYFFVNAFNLLFAPHPLNPLGNLSFSLALFVLPVLVTQIFLIFFNLGTFYKDKKSPAPWFWAIFVITSLGTLYGVAISQSNFNQSPWVATYIFSQFFIWSWHAQIAYQAWSGIASEPTVEDWIKTRYLLIVAYPIVFIIGSLASAVRIIYSGGSNLSELGSIMALITLLAQFVSVVVQYLVWVMPEAFRLWLNRNNQTRLNEHSENQARAILQMIGASMSQDGNINLLVSLRALRQTIGKIINAEDSETIEKHINKMSYQEWVAVLQSPELARQLSLVSAEINIKRALENAVKTLIEKQSLFTIESK